MKYCYYCQDPSWYDETNQIVYKSIGSTRKGYDMVYRAGCNMEHQIEVHVGNRVVAIFVPRHCPFCGS